MNDFRTDLAVERSEIYKNKNNLKNIDGIETEEENQNDTRITRVFVVNKNGERAIGKPVGTYITIDINDMKGISYSKKENLSNIVSSELKKVIEKNENEKGDILIVGLGNVYVTPDALGPKVVPEVDITRHLLQYMPEAMPQDTRSVSAIAPGVLGITGIETVEIIKGVVENTNPKMLIVIDALASRSIKRISSSIQISDTGIVPGGGVENARKEISQRTLGIPVIAMGIPTVVESAVLVNDCLDLFIEKLQNEAKSNDYLNNLKEQDNYETIKETLIPKDYNIIVTPKEIDELIENMKDIVARGINYAVN